MPPARQFWSAMILAFVSIASVLGGISLSLAENVSSETNFLPTSTNTQNILSIPTLVTITSTLPPPINSPLPSNTALPTSTPLPAQSCPQPPAGWSPIITHNGDTLQIIATIYKSTPAELRAINCLLVDSLVPNTTLYVPPFSIISTATISTISFNTSITCAPPIGWVKTYTVKSGDTLFSIAQSFGVLLSSLQTANCIGSNYLIFAGQLLWVPNIPTRTPTAPSNPSATNTAIILPTDPLTHTALPFTATIFPSNTPVPSTITPLPTLTASPTAIP